MDEKQEKDGASKGKASGKKNFSHLKRSATIVEILILLLIIILDQCSRIGTLSIQNFY